MPLSWKNPDAYIQLEGKTLAEWFLENCEGKSPRQLAELMAATIGEDVERIYKAVRRHWEDLGLLSDRQSVGKAIREGMARSRPEVHVAVNEGGGDIDAEELFKRYVALQEVTRKARSNWSDITVTIDTDLPIGVALTSDWHIGPVGTALTALDADIDYMLTVPRLYAYVGGDGAHNMILSTMAHFGSYDGDMRIDDQHILYQRFLEKLKPILLAVGDGNHSWTTQVADANRVAEICKQLRVVYTGMGGIVRLVVGKVTYVIYRVHKSRYNSSFNLSHAVKRLWEFAPTDFDVGVIEHSHQPTIEPFTRHGVTKIAVRTGTYLTDHAIKGENMTHWKQGTPVVVFDPHERRMTPFMDLQSADTFLRGTELDRSSVYHQECRGDVTESSG